jgi:biopolymer transport protein ExbD
LQLKTQFNADKTDLSVVVKGADDVDYQNMVNVLDVLQQLDITKVGLATIHCRFSILKTLCIRC